MWWREFQKNFNFWSLSKQGPRRACLLPATPRPNKQASGRTNEPTNGVVGDGQTVHQRIQKQTPPDVQSPDQIRIAAACTKFTGQGSFRCSTNLLYRGRAVGRSKHTKQSPQMGNKSMKVSVSVRGSQRVVSAHCPQPNPYSVFVLFG
jgi:hypothetical protein